jgi:hypothetical protein
VVQAKFEAAGYKLPQIVFWNLRPGDASSQKSTPVMLHESGAALVSGFRWVSFHHLGTHAWLVHLRRAV